LPSNQVKLDQLFGRLLKGQRFPTPDTMNKIELATLGQVKANDFLKQAQEKNVMADSRNKGASFERKICTMIKDNLNIDAKRTLRSVPSQRTS
jgi:hypothetical protein